MNAIEDLLRIMADLRDPDSGCPWDLQQDFKSIVSYTIEEAYEVADAIAREDYAELKDELGDLLLQVVFHAQMAKEANHFDFTEVVQTINEKMIRRHPHVFADKQVESSSDVKNHWEAEKARERANKNKTGILDGIASALPALKRAQKLQKRAARVGFDWPDASGVVDKMHEELQELLQAKTEGDKNAIAEEVGDLLFTAVNLARHYGVDAEDCLRYANSKFERRFQQVESVLAAEQKSVKQCGLDELESVWQAVKQTEKSP